MTDQLRPPFCSIPEALYELRLGRMIVLVDDEHRENEGDLVCAAEYATPEIINFMLKHARGIVCLALPREDCDRLGLSPADDTKYRRLGDGIHGHRRCQGWDLEWGFRL